MSTTTAALGAMTAAFVVGVLAARWYAVPHLKRLPACSGLTLLLWIHVPRFVALQVISSQASTLAISDSLRDQIVYGDLLGAGLALMGIVLLRYAPHLARPAIWTFIVVTVVDLGNAALGGLREGAFETATDVSWMILTFYVPILWISTLLVGWLATTRGSELTKRG